MANRMKLFADTQISWPSSSDDEYDVMETSEPTKVNEITVSSIQKYTFHLEYRSLEQSKVALSVSDGSS